MSAINAGEVYYFLRKTHSERVAESWRERSATVPATIEVPTADEIWDAALLKGRYPIAYADAFAVALALNIVARWSRETLSFDPFQTWS